MQSSFAIIVVYIEYKHHDENLSQIPLVFTPDVLHFPQLFFSCSLQLLRFVSGLLHIQATDQNGNSRPKYHLEIKQINSNHIFWSEMFVKMQQSQLRLAIA